MFLKLLNCKALCVNGLKYRNGRQDHDKKKYNHKHIKAEH